LAHFFAVAGEEWEEEECLLFLVVAVVVRAEGPPAARGR
jgi:hypothetical protein